MNTRSSTTAPLTTLTSQGATTSVVEASRATDDPTTSTRAPIHPTVAIKLPQFWKANAALWFALAEAQFAQHHVSNTQKFYMVITELDQDLLVVVSDIVLNPTANNSYEKLKRRLIENFTLSEERRVKQLLNEAELGDKQPSTLLREMRSLASGNVTDDFLRTIWLQRLPIQAQAILAASSESLDNLTKIADKIVETTSVDSIAAIRQSSTLDSLQQQITQLTQLIAQLGGERSRGRSQHRENSLNRKRSKSSGFCYYHKRFGANARKCNEPCNFSTPKYSGNFGPGH